MATSIPSPKDHLFRQPSDFSGRCAVPDCGGYLVEHLRPLTPAAQPAPTGNGPEVLPVVLRDLTERQEHGRKKYGTVLRAHNGRAAIQDALEEAYDQVMYLAQLRMEWPELVAQARHDALEEVLQLLEVQLLSDAEETSTELGRLTGAVNGALRRVYAAIRGLQGKPPPEPEVVQTGPRRGKPRLMRKPHRWRVAGTVQAPPPSGETSTFWRCADCPVERTVQKGPRGGAVHVFFTAAGEELARGALHLVRVPLCPPAPAPSKGEP
jgi:hypothetical protein